LPGPDDLATLVYTSGTTGSPKGIAYTHRQLLLACGAVLEEFRLEGPNRVLCWLPMAPLFQRMMNLVAFASATTTYFVEDPRQVMESLREVKPTLFVGVPRFYEKLHDGIRARLAEAPAWRRRLVAAAMAARAPQAHARHPQARLSHRQRVKHAILDRLVLRRIRQVVGGEMKWMISGSAPMSPGALEFFDRLGLLILEAYGLSEDAVPIAANRPWDHRLGSVGKPFALNDIRVARDGELLVRGPGVFLGYHREGRPEERFTVDGYYPTGDYARLDDDGFLYLIGRKTEMIKTSTGRRISPSTLEAVYRQSPFIDDIVIVGDRRPHLAALVSVNRQALEGEARRSGLSLPDAPGLATLPFVRDLVRRQLDATGRDLAAYEQIGSFAILAEPLSVANGDLTTTLKPRRDAIAHRYRSVIEELYRQAPGSDAVASRPHAVAP
jgi:long-chain acyl-CoA synthetase